MTTNRLEIENVVIKFAGDSGDGMQLTGSLFTDASGILGNDIATFPDYPSEIRAPKGTIAGVSGFQVHFGKSNVYSPGDDYDVLVALNPAALKANLNQVKKAGTIIVDTDSFTKNNLEKAEFDENPLEGNYLDDYKIINAPITSLTKESIAYLKLDNKSITRSKNMFALGIACWMFSRPLKHVEDFCAERFKKNPVLIEANIKVLHAGHNFAETIEAIASSYTVLPADKKEGIYRNITGNQAVAWGFLAAAERAGKELFLGSYPITPASEILHELAENKWFGTKVFQAEDEIAGICSALGASFAGNLAVTSTSGPGLALKGEAIGLAVMSELPLVIVNVQRGGPSTGLPTKTEQGDLMQALYGRNGESPVVVMSASTPSNCFDYAFEASRIAVEHMTPVILLTEGYIANGSQPWKIKDTNELPKIKVPVPKDTNGNWTPFARDPETLVRTWAIPGTEGKQHRIGGLEKEDISGCVSYEANNHEKMSLLRAEKIKKIENDIPEQRIKGKQADGLLVVGWGGQYGTLLAAVSELQQEGDNIALSHFNYINPLPKNTAEIFSGFKKIIICELNHGQFANYLRSRLPDFKYAQYNKVKGQPFTIAELKLKFKQLLKEL